MTEKRIGRLKSHIPIYLANKSTVDDSIGAASSFSEAMEVLTTLLPSLSRKKLSLILSIAHEVYSVPFGREGPQIQLGILQNLKK